MMILPDPLMNHRFEVTFMVAGILPNPVDIRFQQVRGLELRVEARETAETATTRDGKPVSPSEAATGRLTLERGATTNSPLVAQFMVEMHLRRFEPSTITVIMFDQNDIIAGAWLFVRAVPVRWAVSDFDASSPQILIETMEFTYGRCMILRR